MNTNKNTILFSIIFAIFTLPQLAYAADYYVAETGIDANPGTQAQPWLTLRKAVQTLIAGDTLYIRGGTYTGSENRDLFNRFEGNSGTSGKPITIKNFPGEIPILDGGFTTISGRKPIFDIDNKSYITLDGLTIRRGSTANIFLGRNGSATDITIRNCDLKEFVSNDNSATIYVNTNTDNIIIENNYIHDRQGTGGNAAGLIIFHTGTLLIKNNVIHDTNIGIYYKHSTDDGKITIIENNLIYNQERWAIEISRADAILRNNIIRDTPTVGILVFQESSTCDNVPGNDNQILHNTIIDVDHGIVLDKSKRCDGAVNTIVKDNLVYNFTSSSLVGLAVYPYMGTDSSNTTFSNNLVYAPAFSTPIRVLGNKYTVASTPLSGSNNIASKPTFRGYATKDLVLQPNSPGKKAASDGTDMGANICKVGLDPCPSPPGL